MNMKAKNILRKKHSYFITFRTTFSYDKIILAYLQRNASFLSLSHYSASGTL